MRPCGVACVCKVLGGRQARQGPMLRTTDACHRSFGRQRVRGPRRGNAGDRAGYTDPVKLYRIVAGSVRAALIQGTNPRPRIPLMSTDTRGSRAAHPSRWPQGGPLESAVRIRRLRNRLCRHDAVTASGPGRHGHSGSVGDGAVAGGPGASASSTRESRVWSPQMKHGALPTPTP